MLGHNVITEGDRLLALRGWPESEAESGVSHNDKNAPESQTRCEDDEALNKVRECKKTVRAAWEGGQDGSILRNPHLEAATSDSVTTVLRRQSERCRLTRNVEHLTHPVTLRESE